MCFNPRPPRGGRHLPRTERLLAQPFQSAPPARGATCAAIPGERLPGVSIRAPRAGGDVAPEDPGRHIQVSIRAPRAGGDRPAPEDVGARHSFNPRPPRGGRLPILLAE